jgi:ribose 5-phosphate isomerase A
MDIHKNMIKGGGGALVRERIVASMSREMVVVLDERKLVRKLGEFPLPVEIIPFGHHVTIKKIFSLGYQGKLRVSEGKPFVTDNHNYIFDVFFSDLVEDPTAHSAVLRSLPGVVDTGFFIGMAGRVFVGHYDGSVEILS